MVRPAIPPIRLYEVQAARLKVDVRCPICKHATAIPAMEIPLPHDATMDEVGRKMRCTQCGRRGGMNVYPDCEGWVRFLRATNQRDRLPWFHVFMSEGGQ